jgi:hypothetical protein
VGTAKREADLMCLDCESDYDDDEFEDVDEEDE